MNFENLLCSVQIACGADHALMISSQGELFAWGRGTWGQTGTATTENHLIPVKVLELEHEYITQVQEHVRRRCLLPPPFYGVHCSDAVNKIRMHNCDWLQLQ